MLKSFHQTRLLVVTWIVLLFTLGGCQSESPEQADVRESFELYRLSLLNRDGMTAVTLVTEATLSYYGDIKNHALHSPEDILAALTLVDRISVYRYRAEWDAETLASLSPGEIFAYAVDHGWVGDNLGALEVEHVRVFGDTATVELSANGEPVPFEFIYRLEAGEWRVDFSALMGTMNMIMVRLVDDTGLGENGFTDYFLRAQGYAGGLDDRIRSPLVQ